MKEFLQGQSDYLFFISGLFLVLLGLYYFRSRLLPAPLSDSLVNYRRIYLRKMGLALLALVLLGWVFTQFLGNLAKTALQGDGVDHLSILSQDLTHAFKDSELLVKNLSESPFVVAALNSSDPLTRERANVALTRYKANFHLALCYLLDIYGTTVAASNYRDPDNIIGTVYSFRPYFQQAIEGKWGHYFAQGVWTNKRGYYVSYPVKDSAQQIIGVAVIKIDIDKLEEKLISSNGHQAPAWVMDQNGLILISTKSQLLFKTIFPVSKELQAQLIRQYLLQDISSLFPGPLVSGSPVWLDQQHYLLFIKSNPIGSESFWSVACLMPYNKIAYYRLTGIFITFLCICLFASYTYSNLSIKEGAQKLAISEKNFRAIFEAAPEAVIIYDSDTRLVEKINPLVAAWTGYDAIYLEKLQVEDLFKCDPLCVMENIVPGAQEKQKNPTELKLYKKDGSFLDVEICESSISYQDKTKNLIFARDITERTKMA